MLTNAYVTYLHTLTDTLESYYIDVVSNKLTELDNDYATLFNKVSCMSHHIPEDKLNLIGKHESEADGIARLINLSIRQLGLCAKPESMTINSRKKYYTELLVWLNPQLTLLDDLLETTYKRLLEKEE